MRLRSFAVALAIAAPLLVLESAPAAAFGWCAWCWGGYGYAAPRTYGYYGYAPRFYGGFYGRRWGWGGYGFRGWRGFGYRTGWRGYRGGWRGARIGYRGGFRAGRR
jgi:hypothetical protein